jgi:hypothetical protein
VALLDFAALTDHSEHFPRIGDVTLFNVFKEYIKITNEFNSPGEFATIVAMEWTPKYVISGNNITFGHLNVYFEGDSMPFFSTFTQRSPEQLFKHIQENTDDDFISWTHHATRAQFASDYAFHYEDINRMIEIYSVHGSCECVGDDNLYEEVGQLDKHGYSIRDALRMGRKYGIMASGDNHDGRLGHSISHTEARAYNQYPYTFSGYRVNHPHPGGITGLFASSLSRKNIFDSLYNRAGYASTWVNRHYIDFRINDLMVGQNDSTVKVPKVNSTREIEILACADGISKKSDKITNIETISIYKNSELWKRYENVNSPIKRISLNDTTTITGTEYTNCITKDDGNTYIHERSLKPVNPDTLNTNGQDYYYVRMTDSNGGAAWIGPIWINPN